MSTPTETLLTIVAKLQCVAERLEEVTAALGTELGRMQEVQGRCKSDTNVRDVQSPLLHEGLIDFVTAAALVPTSPSPHPATISRWCSAGARGIVLESATIGGRRFTSPQAVERFLQRCRKQQWAGISGHAAAQLERALANRRN